MTLKVTANDHIRGNSNAPVEVIEYADFQCPYSREMYDLLQKARKELGDDHLKIVFRNFPLVHLHPHAVHAAIAAETAGAQGRFWEMHDILFENQSNLDDPHLIQYAKEIGLDVNRFEKDFGKDRYLQKVNHDFETGIQNNVRITPALFINGKRYNGSWWDPLFIGILKLSKR